MTMSPTATRWLSRRELLQKSSVGFGQVALASLLAQQQTARADRQGLLVDGEALGDLAQQQVAAHGVAEFAE